MNRQQGPLDHGNRSRLHVSQEVLVVAHSPSLSGTVAVHGAKNAALPMMAASILADGVTELVNIPDSADVHAMAQLLQTLGATVTFQSDSSCVRIDTTGLIGYTIPDHMMQTMRASVLVMGPLLARFGHACIALPGGCSIGSRPVNFHMANFGQMGATVELNGSSVSAYTKKLQAATIVLEYPSVGATENTLMAATLTSGTTRIINAALEPEVCNLIEMLTLMGAHITVCAPATIEVTGVPQLGPVRCEVIPDRLETGSLLLAAAITGGDVTVSNARPDDLDVFLLKLEQMGHTIETDQKLGVRLRATKTPQAISFTTAPFPGFPTDLQAPLMSALSIAHGTSMVHEAVFENRLIHVEQLNKMGASITVHGDRACVQGGARLVGTDVVASDIRASCALVLAGLAAQGTTVVHGVHHWRRGYQKLEEKLAALGADIRLVASR